PNEAYLYKNGIFFYSQTHDLNRIPTVVGPFFQKQILSPLHKINNFCNLTCPYSRILFPPFSSTMDSLEFVSGKDHLIIYSKKTKKTFECSLGFRRYHVRTARPWNAHFYFFKYVFDKVACGLDHSFILSDSGELFGCGLNTDGQLGDHY
ncbi:hypothetical protein MXB_323, partial [Myxobolus squamalis]